MGNISSLRVTSDLLGPSQGQTLDPERIAGLCSSGSAAAWAWRVSPRNHLQPTQTTTPGAGHVVASAAAHTDWHI